MKVSPRDHNMFSTVKSNKYLCNDNSTYKDDEVYIAGLFDLEKPRFGPRIFNDTIDLLNDHGNGWFDDIFPDGTKIISSITNARCDAKVAVPEYWRLKTEWGKPLHGVIGCTCSGPSKAVARIAGLEAVPIISMSSSSSDLSDKEEFSSFSRLVGPDDKTGQVGALVSMLKEFGWSRVGLLTTDTDYASDMADEFASLWKENNKEVGFRITIVQSSENINLNFARAFESIPTHEPRINSRVIILFAHHQDARQILSYAAKTKFQTDTIWIGTDGWIGRDVSDDSLQDIPGYIGLVPNSGQEWYSRKRFLDALAEKQKEDYSKDLRQIIIPSQMQEYHYETMVDSIVLLAKALSKLQPHERTNGTKVTNEMRNIHFIGVNGPITLNEKGDRKNPSYKVMNMIKPESGSDAWKAVGVVTPVGMSENNPIRIKDICWPGKCNLDNVPTEMYDIPGAIEKLPIWVLIVIPIFGLMMAGLLIKYRRIHKKKKLLKANISEIQKKIDQMKNIDDDLTKVQTQLEEAQKRQKALILQRANLQDTPENWVEDSTTVLNEVLQSDDEYWVVDEKIKETMADAWISKLWRVQNQSLWTYYSFHKDKLLMNNDDPNEKSVWHGTSSLDPGVIFNDQQDGFMMQFSQQGFWGRGIYFAKNASYSLSYSHTPLSNCIDRSDGVSGEKEMFLAKLLVGNECMMDRDLSADMASQCRSLTVPPVIPNTSKRYNTVTGRTGGSQVWIVYENGRAYPEYLVRYYRGKRDPERTPLAEKSAKKLSSSLRKSIHDLHNSLTTKVKWEYFDGTWKEYPQAVQKEIETHYQTGTGGVIRLKSGDWSYDIDVNKLFQKNVDHPNHTCRDIRRRLG